jgi:hypothetical protein
MFVTTLSKFKTLKGFFNFRFFNTNEKRSKPHLIR